MVQRPAQHMGSLQMCVLQQLQEQYMYVVLRKAWCEERKFGDRRVVVPCLINAFYEKILGTRESVRAVRSRELSAVRVEI